MTVQGTGKTIDPMMVYQSATTGNGDGAASDLDTSALTHEMLSAGKETVRIINEGAQGNMKMYMGIAIGAMLGLSLTLVLMLVSGHLH